MTELMVSKKLHINCINDNMIQFAINKGYKIPASSIKSYYGKMATFVINYKNNVIFNYEFEVKDTAIFLINK